MKPNAVLVGGQKAGFPVGHYELRSFDGSKTVWTWLEGGVTEALAEMKIAQKRAADKAIAGEAGVQVVQDASRKVLRDEAKRWITSVEDRGFLEAAECISKQPMPSC